MNRSLGYHLMVRISRISVHKKRRDAAVVKYPIILRKRFNCCSFEYDASLQHVDVIENAEAESALAELDRAYGGDDNLYELDAY